MTSSLSSNPRFFVGCRIVHLRVWIVRSRLNKLNERLMLIDFAFKILTSSGFLEFLFVEFGLARFLILHHLRDHWLDSVYDFLFFLLVSLNPRAPARADALETLQCRKSAQWITIKSSSVGWVAASITFNCLVSIDADDYKMLLTSLLDRKRDRWLFSWQRNIQPTREVYVRLCWTWKHFTAF